MTVGQQTGNVASGADVPYATPPQEQLTEEGKGYVHPDTAALFDASPFMRYIPIFGTAVVPFGPKCVMSLGIVYILSKGLARTLLNSSRYAMFMKKYGVTTAVYQRISGIGSLGFSIKPLTAILSDTFAFFGYTKRWYMALSCIAGAVCAIVYGVLPFKPSSAGIAGAMIFISVFCIANIDVLSEGHYSRLIKRHPIPGADLISWIWALIMVGAILASAIQGPLSDSGRPTIGIFLSAGLQAFCVFFFIFNWYGEKKNLIERKEDYIFLLKQEAQMQETDSEPIKEGVGVHDITMGKSKTKPTVLYHEPSLQNSNTELVNFGELDDDVAEYDFVETRCMCGIFGVNKEIVSRNISVAVYGVIMTAGVIALTVLNIMGTTYQLLYGCVGISVILCATGFLCIPMTIMKANFFGWFQQVSYILISGGTDNFYMSDASCLPDGPHFSQTFYNTVGAVIGNAAGVFGVYLFARVFSKQSYRVTLICTTLVQVLASVFDIIIVERWNLYIGIPDHAMYIMGDAIVYEVCYMLNFMPLNMLISRLCPKGYESTMFAILASFSNMGASTSSTIGAILMETVWPLSSSPPCDFSNLRWLLISGHFITPLIAIPLVVVLIPGTRICDPIDPKDVEGLSIFQKWLNKFHATSNAHAKPQPKSLPDSEGQQ
ncbi:BT1 family protein [Leishmania donovani]|uniref:Pteridine_transporter_(Truncated)_-_putative n=3 Tax=Leishmania donovani species complex TaxID=38574 RepID=A0A6L0WKP6_LEIIN|nr:putative pteridine transporter [Leishmania infantum JPCM5]TPP51557.1 BT1 family protein [Leishmania donovani]CAC9456280.1 pteridine_transporter_(truncated)_-_putative [Leishmania infantum]CAC9459263.1 pteridine_transporter_(truncated)_-_putative [Leishmania infantum]CAM66156.1 putative pteridine transporter [Leishmania infantum JPCM5]SUZ39618.1 pteridine_transporter_(truncated)_-_putative [Leishmania infantum]|eukprot:XP_001463787.1 putative pteridine transporter [Leishmania infantum JPCM5]